MSGTPPPVIGYASCVKPRELMFEQDAGEARLTFPVAPTWIYIVQIAVPIAAGAGVLCLPAAILILVLRNGQPLGGALVPVLAAWVLVALGWMFGGVWNGLRYRRWGRVPRVLAADEAGLTLSWLGWRCIRRRHWDQQDIRAIELRPIRGNLTPGRPAAVLRINLRSGRRRTFFLSTRDRTLPARAAERFASLLKCPLMSR